MVLFAVAFWKNLVFEIPQASFINTIKAIRSSKKRPEELTVCKFIKKELQSIINYEINDTLKTLCELGVIENLPSNEKSSYFLIDNINKADSQPHILTIMAATIIEKRTSLETLSPTDEDKIDSFVINDVESNDNYYPETLDLIDSAYKNIK